MLRTRLKPKGAECKVYTIKDNDIRAAYREDTSGRKIPTHIPTKDTQKWCMSKGKNGEPVIYSFKSVLSKGEFQKLDRDMKKIYIDYIRSKYGVKEFEIAKAHGYTAAGFSAMCASIAAQRTVPPKKQTHEQREAWLQFIGKIPLPQTYTEDEEAPPQDECLPQSIGCTDLVHFQFTQTGELDSQKVADRINALVPKGTVCKITVSVEIG